MKTETVGCQWKMDYSKASVQPVIKSGEERGSFVGKKRSALVILGVALSLGVVCPFSQAHALELSEAVAKALNNRPEVSQAIYATAAARERVGSSLSDFLPTVNLRAANGREESDNPTTRATGVQSLWLNPQQRGITVTQNIYRGLGTTHQVLSSQANARSASWKVLEVSEATAMRAVDSYLNVMKNQGQIKAAQESVDSHKALLDLVQRRATSGAGTKADVNQAQARVKQAQAVLSQIQSTQDVAYATFEAIFGHPPEKLQEPNLPDDIIPKERKEALKLALEIHPAIFSAQESYFASKEQALSQNSAFSPAVNLLLTANNDENLAGSPGTSESMSAVVEMTVNAFSGYRDMHAKREATFNMAQAQSVLDKTVLDITENLANSYAQLTAAKSRRELFATQAQENEKVRNAFFKQYRIGQRTLLDLLDVENELFSARNNLVVEHYQELSAKHRVLTNMGQLLRVMVIEVPSTADPLTVDFFSSVQSLFDDPEKVVDRWPAMERWIEQKKMALREPIEQKSPFIPKHNDTKGVEQPGDEDQTPSASPEESGEDAGNSGLKQDSPVDGAQGQKPPATPKIAKTDKIDRSASNKKLSAPEKTKRENSTSPKKQESLALSKQQKSSDNTKDRGLPLVPKPDMATETLEKPVSIGKQIPPASLQETRIDDDNAPKQGGTSGTPQVEKSPFFSQRSEADGIGELRTDEKTVSPSPSVAVKPSSEGTPEQRESQNSMNRRESPFMSKGDDANGPGQTVNDENQAAPVFKEVTGSKSDDAAKQQTPTGVFNWFSFKISPDGDDSKSPDSPTNGEGQTTLSSQETPHSEGDSSPKQQVLSSNQNWPSLRFFSGHIDTDSQEHQTSGAEGTQLGNGEPPKQQEFGNNVHWQSPFPYGRSASENEGHQASDTKQHNPSSSPEVANPSDGDSQGSFASLSDLKWPGFQFLSSHSDNADKPGHPGHSDQQADLSSAQETPPKNSTEKPKKQRSASGTHQQLPFSSARSESDDLERQASANNQSLPVPTEKTKPVPGSEASKPEEPTNDTPWRLPFFSWGNTTDGDEHQSGPDGRSSSPLASSAGIQRKDDGDSKQQAPSSGVTWESSPFIASYNRTDFAEQSVSEGEQAKAAPSEVNRLETTGPVVQRTPVIEAKQMQPTLPKKGEHADGQRQKQQPSSANAQKQAQQKRVANSLPAGSAIKKQAPTKVVQQIRPLPSKDSKRIAVKTAKQQASLIGEKRTQPVSIKAPKEIDGDRQKRG